MNTSQFYCYENCKQGSWPDVHEHQALRPRTGNPIGRYWTGPVVTAGVRTAVIVALRPTSSSPPSGRRADFYRSRPRRRHEVPAVPGLCDCPGGRYVESFCCGGGAFYDSLRGVAPAAGTRRVARVNGERSGYPLTCVIFFYRLLLPMFLRPSVDYDEPYGCSGRCCGCCCG